MMLGSEGRLGIITEATVHVRRIPEKRVILGYLFPTFAEGLAAMQEIAAGEYSVSVTRVSDANETQFSFAMRVRPTLLDKLQSHAFRIFLRRRLGFDLDQMCLSFIGYEGSERSRRCAAPSRREARQAPRRAVHRLGPGSAVRPEEVRHPVHPGLPARPRSAPATCRRRRRRGAV